MKLPLKLAVPFLFMVSASVVGAQTLQTIFSFAYEGFAGDGGPGGLTRFNNGIFYGKTLRGGVDTAFQVTPSGTLTTLIYGNGFTAEYPNAPPGVLTRGNDGNLYGTTFAGGNRNSAFPNGFGMILQITLAGSSTWGLFSSNNAYPGDLTVGNDGNFYGASYYGGITNSTYPNGMGTVFKITTNLTLSTLVSFNFTNGMGPLSALTSGNDGNLYGTTSFGGITNSTYPSGMGTVFQLTPGGTLITLVSFDFTNGFYPVSALAFGNDGNLYGTSYYGGITNSTYPSGMGTIFQAATNGTLRTLYSFTGGNDGAEPYATLSLGNDGNFYGTSAYGGTGGYGTVFQVTTNGALTTLASFAGTNGSNPVGPLALFTDGNFYGTTYGGGVNGLGTVFRLLVAPVLTVQPQSQINNAGATVAFSVGATSPFPLGYQWIRNGMNLTNGGNISGATNSTLTITGISDSDVATYLVIVSNSEGTVSSANATLTVIDPPIITAQPTNLVLLAGMNATFGVSLTGSPPLFQWQFNSANLLNATNTTYTILSVRTNNAGNYSVLITNAAGSATSFNAALTVVFSPTSQTDKANSTATFTVTAISPEPLNYQWQKNGANLTNGGNISGATTSTLTIATVSDADSANYSALVSDAYTGVTTSSAILNVVDPAIITAQPTNLFVLAGMNATFGVSLTGSPPLFQWQLNNANLLNATNATYTIPSVCTNNAGNYSVVVSNLAGSVTSSNAALTVVVSPTSRTNYAGSTATFTTPSFSPEWLSYQWQKNGTNLSNGGNISGATNSTLVIATVSDMDEGNYSALVTNAYGGVNTSNATLTVIDAPIITAQPTNLIVLAGTNVAFADTVTGTLPLHYQWLLNSTNLLNATNAVYTISSVGTNNCGNYSVVITNAAGSVTSSNAALTVILSPTNQTNYASSTAAFVVTAISPAFLNYQWQKNGTILTNGGNISGATNSTLVIATVSDSDAASYTAVVSDAYSHASTSNATLTVIDTLLDVSDPQSQTVLQGRNVTFNFTVYGAPPFIFHWYFDFNGSPLTSTLTQTNVGAITLTNVGVNQTGYYQAEVINADGSLWSGYAYLTVIVPPTLSLQLVSGYPLVNLNAMLGYNFVVQYSTNLATTNWINLLSITNLPSSPYQFLDPSGIGEPQRFYRAYFTQ